MKNRTKIIIVSCIIVLVLLSIQNCSCNRTKTNAKQNVSNNNHLLTNPPLPELDIPYQKFQIEPGKPSVVFSKKGAKIVIPPNAFLDSEGRVVKEKVELSFREFYNPLDFYLAGIPMTYKVNGVEKVFESGGMVELVAKSNNKELFVNPANKIKVDLLSWTKSKDFNLYDLDKVTGKWVEKGKDSIGTITKNEELNALPPIPPLPKVATPASFKIVDETKMYPEMEEYKNVRFEPVDIAKCKISDAQEMTVKPLKNGIYEVTSIIKYGSFRKENKCNCYLSFEAGKDYTAALKIYQRKYAKLLRQRKIISDRIFSEWNNYYAIIKEYSKLNIKKLDGEEKIIRTLTINNFGFVNCDLPKDYPSGAEINPEYVDDNGNKIYLKNVVLVEKNTNALFRYSANVKYNPQNDNILWGLTKNKKIAFIKNADFQKLNKTSVKQKVYMHVHEEKVETYDDIMKVLF